MKTITIPASITIPEVTFNTFADRLGYQPEVEDPTDMAKMISNPESKLEFAQRRFKEMAVMPWLLQFTKIDIDIAISELLNNQKAEQKRAAYDALSPMVTIG